MDSLRAFRTHQFHHLAIAESGTGQHGVRDMRDDAVLSAHNGRDPALRIPSIALREFGFAHQNHVVVFARPVRRDQACQPRTDDNNATHGLAASIRSSATRAGTATSSFTVIWLITSPRTRASSTHAR